MAPMIRPSAFVLALAAMFGSQRLAEAGYYNYQTYIDNTAPADNPYTVGSADGLSSVTVTQYYTRTSISPNVPIDGLPHTAMLFKIHAVSTSTVPDAISGLFTGRLDFFDNLGSGIAAISGYETLGGSIGIGDNGLTFQNTIPSSPIYLNGNTYTFSNFAYTAPTTNGTDGSLTVTIVASPGIVPEPCSLVLMGLGGVAVLARRRFRASTRGTPA